MTHVIEARGLKKSYGAFNAVKGIDFDVPQGKCIGLLGPNGAGKTTTMRMIMGLTARSDGDLKVFDTPVDQLSRAQKGRVGLVPQDNNLDIDLTVRQNLEIYGRYFGLPVTVIRERVPELLEFMQLTEKANERVNHLSGGMQRRLIIARALIADPDFVILDEPTTGLDPQARVLIWKSLTDLKRAGKTLLLTTHYMDEAQRLCDDIVIVDAGKVLDKGTPDELIERHVKGHVFEVNKPIPKALADQEIEQEDIGDSVLYFVNTPSKVKSHLDDETEYLHRPANLEDVFLRLTGRTLRE